jgi:hypothetical protein
LFFVENDVGGVCRTEKKARMFLPFFSRQKGGKIKKNKKSEK